MLDLESSFQLLSTMSPKINRDKNKTQAKSASRLAVKKHFRKSLVYDKKPHFDLDNSVVILDDSFEDDNRESVIKTIKINKKLVIASTSSETVSSDEDNSSEQHIEKNNTNKNVETWLRSLNDERAPIENKKESPNDKLNDRSHTAVRIKQDISINYQENKTIFTPLQNSRIYSSDKQDSMENLCDNQVESFASILDELYGESWREKQDIILPQSEKRPSKPKINIPQPKTERKRSKNNENSKISKSNIKKLKNIFNSSTDDSNTSSDSYYSLNKKRLSFSDSEDELLVKTKRNVVKKSSEKSSLNDSNNFDGSSSGCDESFETRVRRRLGKKKQDVNNDVLKQFESKPRTKLILNDKTAAVNNVKKETLKNLRNDKKTSTKKTDDSKKECKKFSFLYSLSECLPSWQCDPEARFYRDNYKTHRDVLMKKLFELYNEKIFDGAIPKDTPLEWNDRIRQTAGFCYNRRITRRNGTVERHARIVLAPKILDTAARLRDTLVHEMCHAATWIVNNVVDGHGSYWKAWADKAMKLFPELPPIKRCHDYVINTKYTYKCVDCGYSIGRHSKSLDIERKCCGYCHGKFEIFINKTAKNGEKKTALATPKGKANGFALFVKENYNLVKKDYMKHGEVMKLLGQQFSALKIEKK